MESIGSSKFDEVYRKVFYDNDKNKVEAWLYGLNFRGDELDDLLGKMNHLFVITFKSFKQMHINFEVYVWTKFKHEVLNYLYQKNNIKKFSNQVSLENFYSDEFYDYVSINIGSISIDDCEIDVDNIVQLLPGNQSMIFKLRYYNNWTKRQISEFMGLSKRDVNIEFRKLKESLEKYIKQGEL